MQVIVSKQYNKQKSKEQSKTVDWVLKQQYTAP